MAISRVKATYSLDRETMRVLERVAERWGVSKSEALRRAIRASAAIETGSDTPTAALDDLQAAVGLSAGATSKWTAAVRAERRAARPRS